MGIFINSVKIDKFYLLQIFINIILCNFSKNGPTGVLGDYLIEYNNSKKLPTDSNNADKDIVDNLRIRREVLPSMWDVFEKTIEKLKSGKIKL